MVGLNLQEKVDTLGADPPLAVESVDFTIQSPDRLRAELGPTFQYFGRVEGEVESESLRVLLPHLSDLKNHFLDIWVDQENAHGKIFNRLQETLGLTPASLSLEVGSHHRAIGFAGKYSETIHNVFEMIYLSRGAMHERLTAVGYKRMASKLEALGETAIQQTLVSPILKQEAGHLGYYLAAAKELKQTLTPWQLYVARKISIATYAPVGAGAKQDKPGFGQVALALVGEEVAAFSKPVQAIAEELLTDDEQKLPSFVVRGIEQCIEAQRAMAA